MSTVLKAAVLGLTLCATATLPGCVLVAAGAGVAGAAYVSGDLEARLEGTPQQVVDAAKKALDELEIRIVSADATGLDGKVVARTALDRKVEIIVEGEGERASRIRIRVDTFGDEALSRQILAKIESKL